MKPYWEVKTLAELSDREWEDLCDNCGKCCLHKLEDVENGDVFYTCVACRLLDTRAGGCSDYSNRLQQVPDCIQLRETDLATLTWLPSSCAYRLVSEGKPLPWWHPLLTGNRESVHEAGVSVLGKVYDEDRVDLDNLEEFIVHWVDG